MNAALPPTGRTTRSTTPLVTPELSTLEVSRRPSGECARQSVNVPPTSIQNCQDGDILSIRPMGALVELRVNASRILAGRQTRLSPFSHSREGGLDNVDTLAQPWQGEP